MSHTSTRYQVIEIFENPQRTFSAGSQRVPRNSRQNDIEFSSDTLRIWRAGSRHTLQTTRQPTTFDDLNYVRDNQTHRRRVSRNAPKMIDFRASTSSAVMSRTIRVGSNALGHRSTSYTNGVLELVQSCFIDYHPQHRPIVRENGQFRLISRRRGTS